MVYVIQHISSYVSNNFFTVYLNIKECRKMDKMGNKAKEKNSKIQFHYQISV